MLQALLRMLDNSAIEADDVSLRYALVLLFFIETTGSNDYKVLYCIHIY